MEIHQSILQFSQISQNLLTISCIHGSQAIKVSHTSPHSKIQFQINASQSIQFNSIRITRKSLNNSSFYPIREIDNSFYGP